MLVRAEQRAWTRTWATWLIVFPLERWKWELESKLLTPDVDVISLSIVSILNFRWVFFFILNESFAP